jgi:hypothetical protein
MVPPLSRCAGEGHRSTAFGRRFLGRVRVRGVSVNATSCFDTFILAFSRREKELHQ